MLPRLALTRAAPAARRSLLRTLSTAVAPTTDKPVSSSEYAYYKHKAAVVGHTAAFAQVDLAAQPAPIPAMDLIAEEPVRKVHERIVACDGGGGALGHPKVYINLDQEGAHKCGYCGLRFEQEHHHH
ncbi:zinc-finger domain-containing protein [Blastocladiella britannica]|nr:zinc-finger domain-containing protein [Blastocladiella britannica]